MAFNGSGTFLINTAGQPVVAGTVISSTTFNALTADLATGLSTVITKDGQTTVTANIPMASFKFTGLGVGSAATDSATLSQVQSTVTKLLAGVSGTDTVTATASPTLAAYAAGQMFYFVAAGDNTTSVTLNIDALGAKAVTRDGSVALAAADIKSGEVVVVVYDGTRFQVVSQLNSAGDARFANVSIASSLYVGGVSTFVGNAGFSANVSITSALNVGGVATFSAGTAAAPSITTTGDTNTGIFFPAADTIAFTEGGVESMRIDSSGNLGLGTSTIPAVGSTTVLAVGNANGGTQSLVQSGSVVYRTSASTSGVDCFNPNASPITWYTNGTGRMVLDSSGNLGIGTTTIGSRVTIGDPGTGLSFSNATATSGFNIGLLAGTGSAQAYVFSRDNAALLFGTNNTERARLTADGNLLVGTTSKIAGTDAPIQGYATTGSTLIVQQTSTTADNLSVWNSATSGNNVFAQFYTDGATTSRGSITYNRAGGLVAFNTTSDYRAKDILGPVQNSGATIDALKVYEGQMKGATQSRPMLVAHEAQEHAPYAVTGEKDAVNEDGTPKYQQMDVSALVPLLLAELQSLRKRVAELESK